MTPAELKSLVDRTGLPVTWLAKHVGRMSERSFRYQMSGRDGQIGTDKPDVSESMTRIVDALKPWIK